MVANADTASPNTVNDTTLLAAQAAIQSNQLEQAHQLLLEAVQHKPDDFQTWLLLGWTAPTRQLSAQYFQKALTLDPDNSLAMDGLSWATGRRQTTAQQNLDDPQSDPSSPAAVATDPGTEAQPQEEQRPVPQDNVGGLPNALASAQLPLTPSASPQTPRLHLSGNILIPLAYLLAITLAESLTTLVAADVGLILHGLIFVALILHASLAARGPQQRLLLTLMLAPLIRLLSLSLPLARLPFLYWYLITGAPLFLTAFMAARLTGFNRAKLGLTARAWPLQIIVGLSGISLGYIEYLILRPAPLITTLTWEAIWLPALILSVFTGFLEEVIFRGLMQRAAAESLGRFGMLYVAVIFAILHLGYRSALDVAFVFGVALFFGVIVVRTGSILGVTLAHSLTNSMMFLIFPFLRWDSPAVSVYFFILLGVGVAALVATLPVLQLAKRSTPPAPGSQLSAASKSMTS